MGPHTYELSASNINGPANIYELWAPNVNMFTNFYEFMGCKY